jgi:hypothetical protein
MGSYADRVAPLKIGTRLKFKDDKYKPEVYTITHIRDIPKYPHMMYDMTSECGKKHISRSKDDIREEMEYLDDNA